MNLIIQTDKVAESLTLSSFYHCKYTQIVANIQTYYVEITPPPPGVFGPILRLLDQDMSRNQIHLISFWPLYSRRNSADLRHGLHHGLHFLVCRFRL